MSSKLTKINKECKRVSWSLLSDFVFHSFRLRTSLFHSRMVVLCVSYSIIITPRYSPGHISKNKLAWPVIRGYMIQVTVRLRKEWEWTRGLQYSAPVSLRISSWLQFHILTARQFSLACLWESSKFYLTEVIIKLSKISIPFYSFRLRNKYVFRGTEE